jgi:hypothetical protein
MTNDIQDIAYRLLQLEERVEAYIELHAEEISELQSTLRSLRQELFALKSSSAVEPPSSQGAWVISRDKGD